MKICYVIGAGQLPLLYIKKENAIIIAADGGLKHLNGIKPDVVVGDFDSLGYIPEQENTVILPIEKDVTDMQYAISLGEEKGFDTFVIYGGTGGRPDHTMANYALLCNLSKKGKRGYLIGDGYITTAITDAAFCLPFKETGTVSVFSATEKALGVTEKGLKYSLKNHTLTFTDPLGVSNSFVGEDASVSVSNGTLFVMWEESDLKNFIDNLA